MAQAPAVGARLGNIVESFAGKLLLAAPELVDPNFFRTVVLLLEHDDVEGALGVVLNRPSETAVADYLPEWAAVMPTSSVIHVGGPVTPEVAVGLVEAPRLPPEGWAPVMGTVGLVDLSEPPEFYGGVARARVFSGYAGWVAGQLEAELLIRSWLVLDGHRDDVFGDNTQDLWRDVLRRQTGRLAWYADFPADPSVN